jgi:hypothetical protein
MKKTMRWLLIGFGILVVAACALFPWLYTSTQLMIARARGVYETPEQGMRAILQASYSPDAQVKILHAGPNERDGSRPYIWYVTAEVRASTRADGSALGKNGCDNPGSFFLQIPEGWVHVPEGAFPGWMSRWMAVYHLAGPGRSTPSTDWVAGQPSRFCQ